ncbi:MAG: hypothetical protein ACYDGY_10925 [Acidimicrobiales bacterium]
MFGSRSPRWDKPFAKERHPSNIGGMARSSGAISGRSNGTVPAWPVAVMVLLVVILLESGVLPVWPGITHEVALPPLGLISDIGLLLAKSPSVAVFLALLMLDLVVRSTILSFLLSSRWSARSWWLALRFYLVALVPSYIAAQLIYSGQAILYSPLFWAGLALSVLVVLILSPLVWRQPDGGSQSAWSRDASWSSLSAHGGLFSALKSGIWSGFNIPVVIEYLLALILIEAGVAGANGAGRVGDLLGVVITGILTLYVARHLHSGHAGSTSGVPVGMKRLAAWIAVGALVAAGVAFPLRSPELSGVPSQLRGSLFLVAGIDTSSGYGALFGLRPQSIGFNCSDTAYYSYAGPGNGAPRGEAKCPIKSGKPYRRRDTMQSLSRSSLLFRQEVGHLPSPVTVVAHSSGAWVVWDALKGWKGSPVKDVVLLAPMSHSTGYAAGQSGPGIVGSFGLKAITGFGRLIDFGTVTSLSSLMIQMAADRNAQRLFATALPSGVRTFAVESSYDASMAGPVAVPHATQGCPLLLTHTEMAYAPEVMYEVSHFLHGQRSRRCSLAGRWPYGVAAGWRLP